MNTGTTHVLLLKYVCCELAEQALDKEHTFIHRRTVYCVQRQYLPVVRGYGAKVNVGAAHATFTGLRKGKTTSKLIFISNKKNNHSLFAEQV